MPPGHDEKKTSNIKNRQRKEKRRGHVITNTRSGSGTARTGEFSICGQPIIYDLPVSKRQLGFGLESWDSIVPA